jgi:diguanylate cyclase (GGDEF)-like protein
MKIPHTPEDEEQRLNTLKSLNVLDTSPEERFDRLTRMAKRMFGVPIALVSLVDENRQWFKSCIGLSIKETSRDISFCGHAILGNEVFIVTDATKDDRFLDNPLVINEPHIRFYAGCPLRFTNGSKLGTLCIIDKQPRNFDAEDMEALKDLASTAERELAAVQLATQDELTNIINRRGFIMLGKHSLDLCVRENIPACLAYIDLNDFKLINDRFGHAIGDKILIDFTNLVGKICRDSDVFARLGGDEFVILFIGMKKVDSEEFFRRLLQLLEEYNQESISGHDIKLSYGVVDFDKDKHKSIESLLADGDSHMYMAKKQNIDTRESK